MFAVECVRTYKFTKCYTSENMNNNSSNSVPNEEIRHGFEDAVFITDCVFLYQEIDEYSNSAHPEFNFIIISNSYFPIDTPPPLVA